MRGQEPAPYPDSTHHVAASWKWIVALSAPVLAALWAWLMAEIVQDQQSGKGWDNIWLFGFVLATLGGLVVLAFATLVWVFRARVVLSGETMALRGVFGTRVIPVREIEGYRWIKGGLHLYPQSGQWPVNLSYFDNQALLIEWVSFQATDLSAAELAEEDRAISQDPTLGMIESQKEAQLARLRALTKPINWAAYGAAAVGLLNAFSLEDSTIQGAAAAVLVAVPVCALLLALRNPGHVRLDYREGTRYAQVLTGILACSLALGLMSLLDSNALLGDRFHQLLLPVAAVNGALWVFLEIRWIRELYARSRVSAALTVLPLLFLSSFWAGGAIYQINKHLDESEATWSTTEIIGKRTKAQKTTTTYLVKLAPWDGSGGESPELNVSKGKYGALEIGAPIEVGVRRGALEIPWVAEIRPATKAE